MCLGLASCRFPLASWCCLFCLQGSYTCVVLASVRCIFGYVQFLVLKLRKYWLAGFEVTYVYDHMT